MEPLRGFDGDSQIRRRPDSYDDYDIGPSPVRLHSGKPGQRSRRSSQGRGRREKMPLRYKLVIGGMLGAVALAQTNVPSAAINGAASNLNALKVVMRNTSITSNAPEPIPSGIAFPTTDGSTVDGVVAYKIEPDRVKFVPPKDDKAGYFSVGIDVVDIDKEKLAQIKPEYKDTIGRSQFFPLVHRYTDPAVVEKCFDDMNRIGNTAISKARVLVPKTYGDYKPQDLLENAEILYTVAPFVPDVADNPDKYNVVVGIAGTPNNNDFEDPKFVC